MDAIGRDLGLDGPVDDRADLLRVPMHPEELLALRVLPLWIEECCLHDRAPELGSTPSWSRFVPEALPPPSVLARIDGARSLVHLRLGHLSSTRDLGAAAGAAVAVLGPDLVSTTAPPLVVVAGAAWASHVWLTHRPRAFGHPVRSTALALS